MNLSDAAKVQLRALRDDYPIFAEKCLNIRTKEGKIEPLLFNTAQRYIHDQAEDQKRRMGKVRKVIVKGRQQGCSTYVEGRAYHHTSLRPGQRAFILAHEQDATNNIFNMAERFYDKCPERLRPHAGSANAKEMHFDVLDSGIHVGTAGTKGVGRSQTIQFFHGSEVAYWPFAETHATGVMQAIPDMPGTEAWLESTAAGRGNYFHTQAEKARKGETDFELIFIPWFWQAEYRKPVSDGFNRSEEEMKLAAQFNLTDEQLAWRRSKIAELEMDSEFGVTALMDSQWTPRVIRSNALSMIVWHGADAEAIQMEHAKKCVAEGQPEGVRPMMLILREIRRQMRRNGPKLLEQHRECARQIEEGEKRDAARGFPWPD